jgi:enediyne biosynthesis protein E4
MKTCTEMDYNGDNLPDLFMAGNFSHNNIQMGRYDGDYGSVLVNKGHGQFDYLPLNNPPIKGEIRHILPIHVKGDKCYVMAKNNEKIELRKFKK